MSCLGKIWIFLVLGVVVVLLGIVIGGVYFNILAITTSSRNTELVPTYVNAVAVITTGIAVIILFWKRTWLLVLVAMVLTLGTALLNLVVAILTGTHILQPLQYITVCQFFSSPPSHCVCYSPYRRTLLQLQYSDEDQSSLVFHEVSSCYAVQTFLPQLLTVLCGIYSTVVFVCCITAVITMLVYRLEKLKRKMAGELSEHDDVYTIGSEDCVPTRQNTLDGSLAQTTCDSSVASEEAALRPIIVDPPRDLSPEKVKKLRRWHSMHDSCSVTGTSNRAEELNAIGKVDSGDINNGAQPNTSNELVDGGTPATLSAKKGDHKARRKRATTLHNLDSKQLMLILSLQMRYLQEQQKNTTPIPALKMENKTFTAEQKGVSQKQLSKESDGGIRDYKETMNYPLKGHVNRLPDDLSPRKSRPKEEYALLSEESKNGDIDRALHSNQSGWSNAGHCMKCHLQKLKCASKMLPDKVAGCPHICSNHLYATWKRLSTFCPECASIKHSIQTENKPFLPSSSEWLTSGSRASPRHFSDYADQHNFLSDNSFSDTIYGQGYEHFYQFRSSVPHPDTMHDTYVELSPCSALYRSSQQTDFGPDLSPLINSHHQDLSPLPTFAQLTQIKPASPVSRGSALISRQTPVKIRKAPSWQPLGNTCENNLDPRATYLPANDRSAKIITSSEMNFYETVRLPDSVENKVDTLETVI